MDTQLQALYARAWDELAEGARRSRHPFHIGTLAMVTGNANGVAGADCCSMVLREANRSCARLLTHTDSRSRKVARIEMYPLVGWLCFDPAARFQVRIQAHARVERDSELAERRWHEADLNARRCYLCDPSPGTEADVPVSGLPPRLESRHPMKDESEYGRDNFSVLVLDVVSMETLELSAGGHRRAHFGLRDRTIREACWLVP
ncbi:MAG: hypothetical protein ACLFM0_03080 [Spirochaetales bacterium]